MLELISGPPSSLDYAQVIELDTRIREFTVPPPLRSGATHSRQLMMQKASLSTALEAGKCTPVHRQRFTYLYLSDFITVLLQLHRTFFTRALSGPERAFNRRHPFAPSVVAVFLSASRMIATVEALFRREPNLTSRILAFWSNAFSAAVSNQRHLNLLLVCLPSILGCAVPSRVTRTFYMSFSSGASGVRACEDSVRGREGYLSPSDASYRKPIFVPHRGMS